MKSKIIAFLSIFLLGSTLPLLAQKVALIDMAYITERIPEYAELNRTLEERRAQYQKTIEGQEAEVQKLYKAYQKESNRLTAEQRQAREEEIINREESIMQLKRKYFSPDGELAKWREEQMKPLEDLLWRVLKNLAQAGGYSIIMDKASGKIVYADPAVDLSEHVVRALGRH